MKQTRVWRERIYEKTSHDIKASLDDRHASIASGRVSGSSARVSAQHIRRHTRTHRQKRGGHRGGDPARSPPRAAHHTAQPGVQIGVPSFPRYCEQKGSLPSRCPVFSKLPISNSVCEAVVRGRTKLIVIRLYYVPLSARPRGPIAWTCSTRTSNARTSAPAATRASHAPHHRGRRAG